MVTWFALLRYDNHFTFNSKHQRHLFHLANILKCLTTTLAVGSKIVAVAAVVLDAPEMVMEAEVIMKIIEMITMRTMKVIVVMLIMLMMEVQVIALGQLQQLSLTLSNRCR